MVWMLAAVAMVALLVTLFLLLELRGYREHYAQIYELLLAERDLAREESATLRKALFPQLRVTEKKEPSKTQPSSTFTPAVNRRKPFRFLFRDLVRDHNTKQIGHDKLVQAVEKSNV